jgi:hypothetical protein
MADAPVEVEDRLIGEDDGEAGDGVGGRADPAAVVNFYKTFFSLSFNKRFYRHVF